MHFSFVSNHQNVVHEWACLAPVFGDVVERDDIHWQHYCDLLTRLHLCIKYVQELECNFNVQLNSFFVSFT